MTGRFARSRSSVQVVRSAADDGDVSGAREEEARVAALDSYDIVAAPAAPRFDALVDRTVMTDDAHAEV